ncbi:DUF1572 family protein [Flavobacterium sp. NG2]|uniref:DUF1572 family protein n=1 Tax=Flavobacterium sp. NG2 TaxID=3097547 RepID=UPI002A8003E9|nr:DUF1572 family protein [Flavobacterium sp. NG2]WPR70696.1 DUF1572 family protein [Flavobacterium sp. NG2]
MILNTLIQLFNRDLTRLKSEIEAYKTEKSIWNTDKQITNSAGNLCLHIVGNLNTYIGATLGNTGYKRQRDLEFSLKNIPKQDLILKLEETIQIVNTSLELLSEEQLLEDFPIVVFKEKTTTEFMLIHLTTHLAYHLGQINYHRRLLDS